MNDIVAERAVLLPGGEPLAAAGLNLQAVWDLAALPAEVVVALGLVTSGFRQLLLLGNGGGAFWQAFAQTQVSGEDPLDRFAVDCVSRYMAQTHPGCRYRLLYPGREPVIPLQQLGRLAGWHHPSPMGVGINARWGLWFAYRVALLADTELAPSAAWGGVSPCAACAGQPCVSACPAGALDTCSLQLERCLAYRRAADSRCRYTCLAREACPVATAHRYPTEQIRYHYGHSWAGLAAQGHGSGR